MKRRFVGLYDNETKDGALETARLAARVLASCGATPVAGPRLSRALGLPEAGAGFESCAFLVVMGGDGTILSALDVALPFDLPIFGVNLGRVGYLTEVQPEALEAALPRLLAGEGLLEKRMLLEAGLGDGRFALALNDVSLNRAQGTPGILTLALSAGGVLIDRLAGDGLVIASTTGSTAYSLSAGGPIIAPGLDCMVLTPICPHTLHARPVVVSADEAVTVRLLDDRTQAVVLLDGRPAFTLDREHPELSVRRAAKTARFLRLGDRNFFKLLHEKLSEWTS